MCIDSRSEMQLGAAFLCGAQKLGYVLIYLV